MSNKRTPLVSIIIATYNRPDVLKYAIESVLWQTITDWELIVVGDGCNDSTLEVIQKFSNPKIHYHNFKENFGEQSKPNNWGIEKAKGKYIAFLNHDDIYFNDHLEIITESIETLRADVTYSMNITINEKEEVWLNCFSPENKYTPKIGVPASNWMMKKSVFNKVGLWHSSKQLYLEPSQDWLYRAYKAKLNIIPSNHVGVLVIPSGKRINSYLSESIEHKKIYNNIVNVPNYREKLMSESIVQRLPIGYQHGSILKLLIVFIKNFILTIFLKIGFPPREILAKLQGKKKGKFINQLRKNRGLKVIK